jgi:hypothetical protein
MKINLLDVTKKGTHIFFNPMPPHVFMDFVVFPPGHGSSVTDFWGWDAHEAQLRCPDDVSGDIVGWSARKGKGTHKYVLYWVCVVRGVSASKVIVLI